MSGVGISLPSDLLKGLSMEKLNVLAQKDEEFLTYFSQLDLSQMNDIQRKREIMNNKNRELSLENTQLRPDFDRKKESLTNSCIIATELKESYEKKYRQLKIMSGATDRSGLQKELQQAMKKAEKDSEDLADNYLDGTAQMSSDEFVNQFLSERSSYWSRRVKNEKMDVIMKQPLPYPPNNQPIYATPSIGGQPPYPPNASFPPTGVNEPPPPSYNSLTGGNPTQSVSSSYAPPRRTSMPVAVGGASMNMPIPSSWGSGYQQYPQASYRPSPQSSYRPPPQGGPQSSYRPPPQGGPQSSYRPPPQGGSGAGVPPAVGGHSSSYPIYQQTPYYPNQYSGGYPPRR